MYAIFFVIHGIVAQVSVSKNCYITAKLYKENLLKEVDSYYNMRRPQSGMKCLCWLHDKATQHKGRIVEEFL